MTDGLKNAHREAIIAAIAANDRVERAVLFGSRATGTNTASSDVDIALFGDRLTLTDQARLASELDELPMAQSVDLVLHHSIQDRTLREHIRHQGVDWYARPRKRASKLATLPVGTTHPRGLPPVDLIHWPLVPARELFKLTYGRGLAARARRPGNVPVYGTNGRCGSHDAALFEGPGVILGRKGQGPLGVEWSDGPYWVIDTAYTLTPLRQNIDLRFAYYLLKFIGLNHLKDGTSNPTLSRETFGAQALPFPPIRFQRAVAQLLGTLDDKIELNHRMNATLEAMARALFRSWFVDFDPVRAKMAGRDTGLPKEIADLFPDRMVDSEQGEIPESWEVSEIGSEVKAVGGATPSTKEPVYWNGGQHCWATPKDLSKLPSPALLGTDRRITDAGLRKISSGLLPRGTVLLSSRAPIGYLAIAEVPTAVNQGFIAMICQKRLPALYVLSWCHDNLERIKDVSGGSTFAEISKQTFRPLPVVVPPESVLGVYDETSRSLHDRVVSNTRESGMLASLRDALLPKLVSGELRVDGLELPNGHDDLQVAVEAHGA